jgi:hypothetical protein
LKNDLLFSNYESQAILILSGISVTEAKASNQELRVESVTGLLKKLQDLRVDHEKSRVDGAGRAQEKGREVQKTNGKNPSKHRQVARKIDN